jgi:hypothetical protein
MYGKLANLGLHNPILSCNNRLTHVTTLLGKTASGFALTSANLKPDVLAEHV